MAQTLPQAVLRESIAHMRDLPRRSRLSSLSPSSRAGCVRWRSGKPGKLAQIFEFVVEAGGEGSGASSTETSAAARRLDDVINAILVRRAAPDWLPFIPGSSYWVPPRLSSYKLVEALEKMPTPMSDEEVMSLTTAWGWPCSSHLVGGDSSTDSAEKPRKLRTPTDDEDS